MPAVYLAQEVLAQWGITASSAALPTFEDSNRTATCVWNATKMNAQQKRLPGRRYSGATERNHNVYWRSCAGYFTRSVVRQMPRPTRRKTSTLIFDLWLPLAGAWLLTFGGAARRNGRSGSR